MLNRLLRMLPLSSTRAGPFVCLMPAATTSRVQKLHQCLVLFRNYCIVAGDLPSAADHSKAPLPHWVRTTTDEKIYHAKSDSDLWSICRSSEFTAAEAVSFLSALSRFCSPEATVTISQIQKPYSVLSDAYPSLQSGEVMLALRSLLVLGVPADDALVNLLRIKLVSCLYHFSLTSLITFVCFHAKYAAVSSEGMECQQRLLEIVGGQIDQVVNFNLVLLLMTKLDTTVDLKFKNLLHKRMLFLLEAMDSDELLEFIRTLSVKQQRTLPLLTYATERLANVPATLLPKQVADLLTAILRLNYRNLSLLFKLCNDLKRHLTAITDWRIMKQIVYCLGMLRLDDDQLLNQICAWFESHEAALKPIDYCPLIVTLAHCNFCPTLLKQLTTVVSQNRVANDVQWLSVVWALSVLGQLSADNARSVLAPEFVSQVLEESGAKRDFHALQLLNISAAAKVDLNDYDGPVVEMSSLHSLSNELAVNKQKQNQLNMLYGALETICSEVSLQLKTHYLHPMGYVVDAEVKRAAEDANSPSRTSAMFLLLDHRDWTTFSKKLSGPRAMAINHLKKSGSAVIGVSSNQFQQLKDKNGRIYYLKNLLRKNGVFDALKKPQS